MASNGDGHDENSELLKNKDNVVYLKVPRQSQKKKTTSKPQQTVTASSKWSKIDDETALKSKAQPQTEALINLPPTTKYLLLLIVTIHLGITLLADPIQTNWIYFNLGFIPSRFTDLTLFDPLTLITPLTHMFLHGSGLHVAMNGIMLLAFGAGVEKWLGGKTMLKLFILSGFFGLILHLALNFSSGTPVIGASGGLSGLFAVALVMLNRQNSLPMGKYGFLPLILLWVGISVLFGSMGSPDGSQIAWAAHVGGFIGGFVLIKAMKI